MTMTVLSELVLLLFTIKISLGLILRELPVAYSPILIHLFLHSFFLSVTTLCRLL